MKRKRHQHMMRLINENDIKTQEQLTAMLRGEGFEVTQATVSRDIKELGLVKTNAASGGYKYSVRKVEEVQDTAEHLDIFARAVVGVDSALNQVVIRTFAGMAQAVAASLDRIMHNNMLGSIAGDDTVLLILRTEEDARVTVDKLKRMFSRKERSNVN